MKVNRLLSALMLVAGIGMLQSCENDKKTGSPDQQPAVTEAEDVIIDNAVLTGVWEMSDLYHSMMEKEFDDRLKYLDTMTVLELGQIAMWNTSDVDKVRESERKMISEERNNYKKPFLGATYTFLNDSLLVRKIMNTVDTNIYKIQPGKILLSPMSGQPGQGHALYVKAFSDGRMKVKEQFPGGNEIITDFKKQQAAQ